MIAKLNRKDQEDRIPAWHLRFMAMVPAIRRRAEHGFRKLPPDQREEMVQEVIANCFATYARLVERGSEDLAYPSALARFAVAQVRQGRQVGTRLNVLDVSSQYAQRRKGFRVERLDQFDSTGDEWKEVLIEDRRATPADVAASRIDFAVWLGRMSSLRRKIAKCLATGESTCGAAQRFSVSPGRISQLRHEFKASWLAFHGEPVAIGAAVS